MSRVCDLADALDRVAHVQGRLARAGWNASPSMLEEAIVSIKKAMCKKCKCKKGEK